MQKQNFFTPIKYLHSQQKRNTNSDYAHRSGDWICLNCQNLNYSFRKKCNRCKTQTRQSNEAQSIYSYYYYHQIQEPLTAFKPFQSDDLHGQKQNIQHFNTFTPDGKENIPFVDKKTQSPHKSSQKKNFEYIQTPKKKSLKDVDQEKQMDNLPSVSPLVKKYQLKEHRTTLEKLSFRSPEQIGQGKKYQRDFEHIQIRDFQQFLLDVQSKSFSGSPYRDFPEENQSDQVAYLQDLEQSIARIIL